MPGGGSSSNSSSSSSSGGGGGSSRHRSSSINGGRMRPRFLPQGMASSPFFRAGLPLLVLLVGGSAGLSMMVEGKIEGQERRLGTRSMTTREWNEEEEYKKIKRRLARQWDDTSNLEMKRIEREAEKKG